MSGGRLGLRVAAGPESWGGPRCRRVPGEQVRPPSARKVENKAERGWDRGWNKDWDKLEKLQRRDEPVAPAPPHPETLQKVRDENMDAAENAYRELVAERERAKRQSERGPRKPVPKKNEKGEGNKEKQQ